MARIKKLIRNSREIDRKPHFVSSSFLIREIRAIREISGSRSNRIANQTLPFLALLLLALIHAASATADETANPADSIDPTGIPGALVICGGGSLPDVIRERFMSLAGGRQARLVVVPSASDDEDVEQDGHDIRELWQEHRPASIDILHTRSREAADAPYFVEPLQRATGVWFTGGKQTVLARTYTGTAVEHELHALVKRGGVIGGTSAGAAILSGPMIVRTRLFEVPGLGLLPGGIIDQHFLVRDRKARLFDALDKHPGYFGAGVDEGTALIVQGRQLTALGESSVTLCLAPSSSKHPLNAAPAVQSENLDRPDSQRPRREIVLKSGEVADLTALRRAALSHTAAPFPAAPPASPALPHGSLMIVGGGRMTPELWQRFVELSGGADALIVILPTALPDPLPERIAEVEALRTAGARQVKVLTARRHADVDSAAFLSVIEQAGGIWFGGGRQWRFVDAYAGTRALPAFHALLQRGGAIGGSSAGASIQAEYLARGSPLGNTEMMSEGYERGFAFLPGTAIDQHFTERKRAADLAQVVKTFPQLLGIGIDESTALIVQGTIGTVQGRGKTHFYHQPAATEVQSSGTSSAPSSNGVPASAEAVAPQIWSLGNGRRFDLTLRSILPESVDAAPLKDQP